MAIAEDTFFKNQDDIHAEMIAQLQVAIPDVYVGDDGVISIKFRIESGQLENAFLANQLALEDMFIQTASLQALKLYGEQFGVPLKDGTRSAGSVQFSGNGGTYVPINTEVAYDPGGGIEPIYFLTTLDGTIPNPGNPTAPTVATGAAGTLTGSYEYVITFVTAAGETLQGPDSAAVSPSAQQVTLTNIPVGGVGTTARRIYRDKNGSGVYRRVGEITNNTATTFTDNVPDATVAGNPQAPTTNTASAISVPAQAEETGAQGNVSVGTITELTNAPSTLTDVVNLVAFTGGSDAQDTEDYRQDLLQRLQNPSTGSPGDLKSWAEQVDGVESATVFTNDNNGTPTNGHVTVRISGPNGSVPSGATITEVLSVLQAKDMANVTIHVSSFVAMSTNVTVDVTTEPPYTLADVQPNVTQAIIDFINALEVGETLYLSQLVSAIVSVPGVIDAVVSTPSANLGTAAPNKRTPGTITVT